jgi:integrase
MSVWFCKNSKRYRIRIQRSGSEIKRILPKGATRTQAEEEHQKLTRELIDHSNGKPQDIALSEGILKYLEEEVPKLKSKIETERHIKALEEACKGRRLKEIGDVANKYRSDKKDTLAPATINNRLALLRRIANLSHKKWKLLKEPVYIEINDPKNERHVYLSMSQVKELILATNHQPTKDAIKIAVYTGVREGVIFDPYIQSKIRDDVLILPDSKNGEPLIIPILDEIREEINRLPMPCAARTMWGYFKEAANAIGMPDLRFHDLRHTTASLLLNAGYDLKVVAEVLGHKSLKSTNRYAHLTIERKKEALKKIFGQEVFARKS